MLWEYQDVVCGRHNMDETLKEFGENEWECFQIIYYAPRGDFSSSMNYHLFFKRFTPSPSMGGNVTDAGEE